MPLPRSGPGGLAERCKSPERLDMIMQEEEASSTSLPTALPRRRRRSRWLRQHSLSMSRLTRRAAAEEKGGVTVT